MHYTVYIHPQAWKEVNRLPGHIKQRVRKAIKGLSQSPRLGQSKPLTLTEPLPIGFEARQLRLDRWRIIYVIDEEALQVHVLAVRKRPPYDYGDLEQLLQSVL